MARDADVKVIYESGEHGRSYDVRAAYVTALRPGDEAWVPTLDVLMLPKSKRGKARASADLGSIIAAILGRGAIIVDVQGKVTSRDGKKWQKHVELVMRRVGAGRMSHAKAKRIGRLGGAAMKAKAAFTRWDAPAMAAQRKRWASVWRDPIYTNDDQAADAIEPEELKGRKWLCRRIFGPRRPGDKRAGGRPRGT